MELGRLQAQEEWELADEQLADARESLLLIALQGMKLGFHTPDEVREMLPANLREEFDRLVPLE